LPLRARSALRMMREERHLQILERIQDRRIITVSGLAQELSVSEMTIRRDLQELDASGKVIRVHGGAKLPDQTLLVAEPPMLERMKEQADVKRRIAQAAANLISRNETIFIGSGTTTLAVAEAIKNRQDLTVITNALTVANSLAGSRGMTVLVIGGFLRRSELSLIGHVAESGLKDIRVDKVIMGIRGIDPSYGLTSDHPQELMTDRAIMRISDILIIVTDHTKFGHIASSRTAPLTAATMIITDELAPENVLNDIRKQGVRIIKV